MICSICNEGIEKREHSAGYATDSSKRKICYQCCADQDREYMNVHDRITLYLAKRDDQWHVTNWPGTLAMLALVNVRRNGHNWGLTRRDAWFQADDGAWWWGVSYGDWTDLIHCKKLLHEPVNVKWGLGTSIDRG